LPRDEETISSFVEAARNFVALIERLPQIDEDEFFEGCLVLLPLLLSLGRSLTMSPAGEDLDRSALPESDRWIAVGQVPWLDRKYRLVWDPLDDKEEPLRGQISVDLSEIYVDLKQGLLVYDSGTEPAKADALWQWQFDFNWGLHTAQHILHVLPAVFSAYHLHEH